MKFSADLMSVISIFYFPSNYILIEIKTSQFLIECTKRRSNVLKFIVNLTKDDVLIENRLKCFIFSIENLRWDFLLFTKLIQANIGIKNKNHTMQKFNLDSTRVILLF